ncbi:MAG: methyltransferase family protein [Ignavibacteria bacterium]
MKNIGKILFKYRSYTPLPFIFVMFIFMNPNIYSILSGLVLTVTGELIRIFAVSYAGSETRTTSEVGGSNLVTQGPFSIIRNPLYAGNILIYLGIGIMSYTFFPYLQIVAVCFFIFQYYAIILNEEEYLRNQFKEKYALYCRAVKRFLPFPKPIPPEAQSKLPFDFTEGLKSETRTLQALIILTGIIIIYYLYI